MFTLKKINNNIVTPIPTKKLNPNEIKGYSLFSQLYCNIFICAQKGSGKTNVINEIIKECIDSTTKVIVFSSTHNNDNAWRFIKKYLEKKNISSVFYTSIEEDKVDKLDQLLDFFRNETPEIAKEKEIAPLEIMKFDEISCTLKIKKPKEQSPKYLIIFDDLSIELKKKNVPFLLKTFRHYKSKVIISTQYFNDLPVDARLQIDYLLLFKGNTQEKVDEHIYPIYGCNLTKEEFYDIYKKITSEQYQFLYISKNDCQFRKNFTELIKIKDK
jgi:hypothetical protein